MFTCAALRFKPISTFPEKGARGRGRCARTRAVGRAFVVKNKVEWHLESPECSVASSTKRDALLSNANSLNRECLTIRIDETTKEYEQWNQHAQHTKLRFYVDSARRRAHKGDESFFMQVQDGSVELRDRKRKAIKEVKKKERVKLEPGWSIKFHDAGELRVMRNVSAHA